MAGLGSIGYMFNICLPIQSADVNQLTIALSRLKIAQMCMGIIGISRFLKTSCIVLTTGIVIEWTSVYLYTYKVGTLSLCCGQVT